jgi:hypothetical protein
VNFSSGLAGILQMDEANLCQLVSRTFNALDNPDLHARLVTKSLETQNVDRRVNSAGPLVRVGFVFPLGST